MPMNKIPEGCPLEPKDFAGNVVSQGDIVRILRIPDWLIHGLDDESKKNVESCEGSNMSVYEIDEYG